MFNWNDIRYFLALHHHGTLAAAGAALQADPTTVSRRLIKLEDKLGARLFDRTPGGYVLTEAGHRLLPRASGIEREVLGVERDVAGEDRKLEGTVRLAATEMLTTRFLAPHLRGFRDEFPGIQLDLMCTNQEVNLTRREADIAVRLLRPTQDDLVIKRLAFVDVGLYAAAEYIERFGTPSDTLDGHELVMFADRRPFHRENTWLEARAARANVAVRVDSVSAVYSATVAGVGISLLPCLIADRDERLVRIPVNGAPEPRQIWQAVHKDVRQSARVQAVLGFLGAALTNRANPKSSGESRQAAA
ncbi:MAG: LysR family transcriptional regulator [Myxococcota bacterium]